MASSVLRWLGLSRYPAGTLGCCRNFAARTLQFHHRMISTTGDEPSPLLMLPPTFEGDDKVYNFYSLAQKKVLKHSTNRRGGGEESESPDDDAVCVGSSHGWLALFNRRNNDLFLTNPLSGRHIKLSPIEFLPDDKLNLINGRGSVTKVILSSSPDDKEGCCVMMTFGPANRLAFCSLGSHWTPIGSLFCNYKLDTLQHLRARVYEDLVYCKGRNVLTCMTWLEIYLDSLEYTDGNIRSEMEDWDIEDMEDWDIENFRDLYPVNAVELFVAKCHKMGENTSSWLEENRALLEERCVQIPHLVYAQQCDHLYLVLRFVEVMAPDGKPLDRVPICPIRGLKGYHPCKTFGFIVFRVDRDGCYEVVDDLNGLAIFVGINHSYAVSVADSGSSELKPNSIYFTSARRIRMLYGNDTVVFDYECKTISPIIDPDDDAFQLIESNGSSATSQIAESSTLWFYS